MAPRIEVPAAPNGTPGTRYAVAITARDGSTMYMTRDGWLTDKRDQARVFDRRDDAEHEVKRCQSVHAYEGRLELIDDLDEFVSR